MKKQLDEEKLAAAEEVAVEEVVAEEVVEDEVVEDEVAEVAVEEKKKKKKKKKKKTMTVIDDDFTSEEEEVEQKETDAETTGFLPQEEEEEEVEKGEYDTTNPVMEYDNVSEPSTARGKTIIDRRAHVRNSSMDDLALEDDNCEDDNICTGLKDDVFDDDEFQTPIKSYDVEVEKMKKTRLQTELRALSINTTGNLRDLKARLLAATGLDVGYAFDSLESDSNAYPTPAPDFAYETQLTIPTDKKSLRNVFKTRFRHRNMFEAVEVLRHQTACPRSILYRPEELRKIRAQIVSLYDREMRKRKKTA
jgi:hypothetical protein